MNQEQRLLYLIEYLFNERGENYPKLNNMDEQELFKVFRSLVNVREPKPADEKFLQIQDEFLKEKISRDGIIDISQFKPVLPNIYLWQGDIIKLKCDAIVNAANSKMLGCFVPCHSCIDNAIHTFAGVQLREECASIMKKQGFDERVGAAKVTNAYNLPCKMIVHTVGPFVEGKLTQRHVQQLESCYLSCLTAAVDNSAKSIAFCCVSTGVFGFPQKQAAEIAVETVKNFLKKCEIKVIFNVFKQQDKQIYRKLLEE